MSSRPERIGNVDNADIDNVKEQTTAFAQSRDSVLLAYIAAAQRGSLAPPNISDMDTTDLIQVIEKLNYIPVSDMNILKKIK